MNNLLFFARGHRAHIEAVDIIDVIAVLNFLFSGGAPLACDDAGDANDDNRIDLADPIYVLGYLLRAESPPG